MKKILVFTFLVIPAFIWLKAQNWNEIAKALPTPYTQNLPDQYFGESVAIDGNYAVIGAHNYDSEKGAAFVYYYDGSSWTFQAKLTSSDRTKNDRYGVAVGISGNTIVVGAPSAQSISGYAGRVYVYDKPVSGWIDMTETAKLEVSNTVPHYGFGYSVSISGNTIVANNGGPTLAGAVNIFTKPVSGWTNMTPTAVLTTSDGVADDGFGVPVFISGDCIVAAAQGDDDNGFNTGSAYVFTKPATGWINSTETAKIKPSDSGDFFGCSVGISGDDIIVGAYGAFYNGIRSGAAYIFSKPASGWVNMTQTAKIAPSDGALGDLFGNTICISGDNIVVGAADDDDLGTGAGSAYIFSKPITGWVNMTQTAKIMASDGFSGQSLGRAVCISGNRVILGVSTDNTIAHSAGAAYAYNMPVSGWVDTTETQKILPPVYFGNYNNYFGKSVAIDGDYAVVGAYGQNDAKGKAYVLFFDGNNWITQAKLSASDSAIDDKFGYSVGISGDNIVVGAYSDDDNGSNSGSAYVFTRPVSGWTDMSQTAKLTPSDGTTDDQFGFSVSISGDNIVVGSNGDDDNGINSGSAYIFTKPPGGWIDTLQNAKLKPSDGNASDKFGSSVGISGDYVVIGSPNDSAIYHYTGSAFVFKKPVNGWVDMTETAKLYASDGQVSDKFGSSVCISGNYIVVGAIKALLHYNNIGAAYIFTKPTNGWVNASQNAKITPSDSLTYCEFGCSVAISGDNIIVGASSGYISSYSRKGSAYVYVKPLSGWIDTTQTIKINSYDSENDDGFGSSVGISGDYIIAGAPYIDNLSPNGGSAYLFKDCYLSGTDNVSACIKYTWRDGITYTSSNNTAKYRIMNPTACDSIITLHLNLSTVDINVSQTAGVLTANAVGATYQWLNCDDNYAPIIGETAQIYSPPTNGKYAVEVNQNGCTDTSACQNIAVGIKENILDNQFFVLPNPASTFLKITNLKTPATADIYDISGKLLLTRHLPSCQIDISSLENGLYFIKITTAEGSVVKKFVKE